MDDVILLKENSIEALKLLGNGASGRVYLSYNNELGIISAKVMSLEKFYEREWDAAGKLNRPEFQCPFIMKYLRAKAFETDAVILMEYANAKSVDSIVKDKTKNLSSGTCRALSKQILEGMRLVHAAGLIHRDIKAENIMMHSSSGSIKVKIADFGLAKVISEAQLAVTDLGTPFNMAPELLLGTSPGNNKVDMWSVGVVLFQLATHEYPIKANSLLDLQKKMKMQRIEQFKLIKDNLLRDLLTKLLEFDPNKRFSAEQALQHSYFTSSQAFAEVNVEARQISLNASIAFQNGDKQITKYDLDQTFTAPTSEIMTFLNMNPEAEQQKILSTRFNYYQQDQQDLQPIQITPQVLQ
ncbi:MAG: putative SNF1A/AMP-activated protein kinase [Streblomastix strix]|uniref:Putative SNF1A/AMP-activated protein kinase n=1 Tax=Streblomastix strix TaxID=222440 RepID=A0A5J4X151_9EUKA|nr:MAG: putative SNF1A/AMP-activated protein kinase [Streblomastix strix]